MEAKSDLELFDRLRSRLVRGDGALHPDAVALSLAAVYGEVREIRGRLKALELDGPPTEEGAPAEVATVYVRAADGTTRHGSVALTPRLRAAAEHWPKV